MKRNEYYWGRILKFVIFIIIIFSIIPMVSIAERKEYEVSQFEQNIIISANSLKTIDVNFQEGKALEFIYSLQVKQELPIDAWLVNLENYNRFVSGGEYLYYIDGSAKQTIAVTRFVSFSNYGSYKLILANYNNQSVEASIAYEMRTYKDESNETSSEDLSIFMYSLIIPIIILAVLLGFFIFKSHKYKRAVESDTVKESYRKSRRKAKPSKSETKPSKKSKKEAKPFKRKALSEKVSERPKFCGNCGKPVVTPFCKHCGHKV